MFSQAQHIIMQHIYQEGDITRYESEVYGISLDVFLDAVANLVYQRILETSQMNIQNKGGRPVTVNKYTFSLQGKRIYHQLNPKP